MRTEKGNALFEMMLFTPLALFFLLTVIDGGIAFVERASTRDCVRTALSYATAKLKNSPWITFDHYGEAVFDDVKLAGAADTVLAELLKKVEQRKGSLIGVGSEKYRIEVGIVEVSINSQTGQLVPNSVVVKHNVVAGDSNLQIPDTAATKQGLDYVNAVVEQDLANKPSKYSLPLGPSYNGQTSELHYFDKAALLYLQIQTNARTIGGEHTKRVIGKLFSVNEQELIPLRKLTE